MVWEKRTRLQSHAAYFVSCRGILDWREGEGGGEVCHRATDGKAKVGQARVYFRKGCM